MKASEPVGVDIRKKIYMMLPACGAVKCADFDMSPICKQAVENVIALLASQRQSLIREILDKSVHANVLAKTDNGKNLVHEIQEVVPIDTITKLLETL